MSTDKKPSSNVKVIETDDLDEILGTKASTVIAPTEESKRSVLESTNVDTSFLDKMDSDKKESEEEEEDAEKLKTQQGQKDALADILDSDIKTDEEEEEEDLKQVNKGGRKPALIEAMSKLVDKGVISLFSDQPDIHTYTIEDIEELIAVNIQSKSEEAYNKAPMEIFGKLDPKIQDVVAYNLKGGKDVLSVLKNVIRSQEVTELSLENPEHHERIVREWLRETQFGSDEEIEDEITAYIDRGDLGKKAEQFKPKLDKKQAEILQSKLDKQEQDRLEAEEAKKVYAETIFKALNKPDLGGIPLNNRIQTSLYYGIVETNEHQDKDGNPTNKLGHLLEKYQFGKDADPEKILKVLWLLEDEKGFMEGVMGLGAQKAHATTARELRTAEGARTTSSPKQGEGLEAPIKRQPVSRPAGRRSIFQRD